MLKSLGDRAVSGLRWSIALNDTMFLGVQNKEKCAHRPAAPNGASRVQFGRVDNHTQVYVRMLSG
jgi:hypothetical protein